MIDAAPITSPQATLRGDPNDPHTLLRGVFQFYCRYGRTGARGTAETTIGTFTKIHEINIRNS